MTKLFEDMMTGLDEVEAFLSGETIGCKERPRNRNDTGKAIKAKPANAAALRQTVASQRAKDFRPAQR